MQFENVVMNRMMVKGKNWIQQELNFTGKNNFVQNKSNINGDNNLLLQDQTLLGQRFVSKSMASLHSRTTL